MIIIKYCLALNPRFDKIPNDDDLIVMREVPSFGLSSEEKSLNGDSNWLLGIMSCAPTGNGIEATFAGFSLDYL